MESASLEWVAWFNHGRLLEPVGYLRSVEHGEAYYRREKGPADLAAFK